MFELKYLRKRRILELSNYVAFALHIGKETEVRDENKLNPQDIIFCSTMMSNTLGLFESSHFQLTVTSNKISQRSEAHAMDIWKDPLI